MVLLAQLETVAVFVSVVGCYGLVVGVIWKVVEHVYQADQHPNKKDIVFRDVCETKHAGTENTWKAELDAAKARIEDLKKHMEKGFDEVKKDVCEVKNLLLQSNGPKHP